MQCFWGAVEVWGVAKPSWAVVWKRERRKKQSSVKGMCGAVGTEPQGDRPLMEVARPEGEAGVGKRRGLLVWI